MLVFWYLDVPADQDRLITRMLSDNQPQLVHMRRLTTPEMLLSGNPLTLPLPDLLVGYLAPGADPEPLFSLINEIRALKSCDFMVMAADRSMSLFVRARQAGALDYLLIPCTNARLRAFCSHYLSLSHNLKNVKNLNQRSIDAAFNFGALSPGTPPPSAMQLKTLRKILQDERVASGAPFCATDLSDSLSLSRVAIRNYLEQLSEMGYLSRLPNLTGRIGRPKIYYIRNMQRDIT